jgi:hypothetical protein
LAALGAGFVSVIRRLIDSERKPNINRLREPSIRPLEFTDHLGLAPGVLDFVPSRRANGASGPVTTAEHMRLPVAHPRALSNNQPLEGLIWVVYDADVNADKRRERVASC